MDWRTLHRRDFLKTACLGTAALALPGCASVQASKNPERPNVILVMTDDQGYGDFGVAGNPMIRTPCIDAMARRSAQMTSFYVSPVCAPTRASLMTGRYNYRTRCIDTYIGRAMMDPEEVTLAEVLQGAGYATGAFGKWHLGDCYPMRPTDQGFDLSLVHRGGGIGQPSDPPGGEKKYTDPILFRNGKQEQASGYCTDVYFDEALKWIEASAEKGRNFCAYIATNAPHSPLHDVPEDLLSDYLQEDLSDSRFPQDRGHKLTDRDDLDARARIYSMITNIDDNMGRLFEKLKTLGLYENTLVIFMVDNGPNGHRYVAGMRGRKGDVHEGGIRSPLFMHWPARLEAGRASDRVAAHIDIMPTILEACRVPLPGGLAIDGRNVLPLLEGMEGDAPNWSDRTVVIQAHRGDTPVRYHHFAARNQRWKLLHASGFGREQFEGEPKFELYDMAIDPLEMQDRATDHPEIVEAMRLEYDAWFDGVSRTRPDNYAPPRIVIGTEHENPTVLTRQDWKHLKGRPWAGHSNGQWLLTVAIDGRCNVRFRFPAAETKGRAVLNLGAQTLMRSLSKGDTECLFEGVLLSRGDTNLQGDLITGKTTRGPYQVDLVWQ